MISQSFIQELLSRVDVVDVIERDVPLRKAGTNFTACCPFHSEKTPSFTVSPTKQFYHCFGCGAHGSAIGFAMEYNGMSFVEAVNDLAARVGLQVPAQPAEFPSGTGGSGSKPGLPQSIQQGKEASSRDLLEVMDVAARFYREQLRHSESAVAYLRQRGLTGKTAAHFGIGYAPSGWQNLGGAFSGYEAKVQKNLLVEAGLAIENADGNCYDRFRDRIMFPILNLKGTIAGFGGRILAQGEPKYLNSPETPLFQKGRELYNLFAARRAIREAGRVIVVEGYMDVVALFQHGIEYAVAALGTATTPFHVQKLLRQTDDVVFCFDGDSAGRKAAWRALEDSLAQLGDGKSISFLFLPEGEDPDSYVRNFGKEAFEELLKQTVPLSVFLFRELSARVDLKTSEGRAKLVQDAKPLLAKVIAPGLALMLLKKLAEISGLSQRELEDLLKIRRVSASVSRERAPRPKPASPYRWLLQVLLYDSTYIGKLDRELLTQDEEYDEEVAALAALVEFIDTHPNTGGNTAIPSATAYFHDSPHRMLLEKAESQTLAWDSGINVEAEFAGAMARLHEMRRKQRMTKLHSKSLSTLTPEEKQELQRVVVS
ncbi:DNA primase [Nitrosospira briensis]|uniref:DNA primase n=1 Tax=Nitrosospira briensis TaxID=35799 RepID=A0A1I5D584_9PROT|nr:DNA primase [Nitrosospira briensis]SFN94408.1 DNA primase [Nitrosospira briensis]